MHYGPMKAQTTYQRNLEYGIITLYKNLQTKCDIQKIAFRVDDVADAVESVIATHADILANTQESTCPEPKPFLLRVVEFLTGRRYVDERSRTFFICDNDVPDKAFVYNKEKHDITTGYEEVIDTTRKLLTDVGQFDRDAMTLVRPPLIEDVGESSDKDLQIEALQRQLEAAQQALEAEKLKRNLLEKTTPLNSHDHSEIMNNFNETSPLYQAIVAAPSIGADIGAAMKAYHDKVVEHIITLSTRNANYGKKFNEMKQAYTDLKAEYDTITAGTHATMMLKSAAAGLIDPTDAAQVAAAKSQLATHGYLDINDVAAIESNGYLSISAVDGAVKDAVQDALNPTNLRPHIQANHVLYTLAGIVLTENRTALETFGFVHKDDTATIHAFGLYTDADMKAECDQAKADGVIEGKAIAQSLIDKAYKKGISDGKAAAKPFIDNSYAHGFEDGKKAAIGAMPLTHVKPTMSAASSTFAPAPASPTSSSIIPPPIGAAGGRPVKSKSLLPPTTGTTTTVTTSSPPSGTTTVTPSSPPTIEDVRDIDDFDRLADELISLERTISGGLSADEIKTQMFFDQIVERLNTMHGRKYKCTA